MGKCPHWEDLRLGARQPKQEAAEPRAKTWRKKTPDNFTL